MSGSGPSEDSGGSRETGATEASGGGGASEHVAPPTPVRWAAVGVLAEGAAALVATVVLAVSGSLSFAVWGFGVLVGAGVIAAGVALLRGVRGARGPAVVTQLLLLGIAYYASVPSERPEWGFPMALLAAAVLVGLLGRPGREWAGS